MLCNVPIEMSCIITIFSDKMSALTESFYSGVLAVVGLLGMTSS